MDSFKLRGYIYDLAAPHVDTLSQGRKYKVMPKKKQPTIFSLGKPNKLSVRKMPSYNILI